MPPADPNDYDDDDDGIYDSDEGTPQELPESNPETWVNGDVHVSQIYGRTDPRLPDSDGDGLPDGWERRYGFDPFDGGAPGQTNMSTGLVVTNALNGPDGNPDGDTIVDGAGTV